MKYRSAFLIKMRIKVGLRIVFVASSVSMPTAFLATLFMVSGFLWAGARFNIWLTPS